jgi:hypothetical protein
VVVKSFSITYVLSMELGIATGYGLDVPGSIPGAATFSVFHSVQTDFVAHPLSYPNLPNLSSRTMALGSTQPLTEMSTRNL